MTNLFAAVFWLIAALINTGGDDDSLRSLQATDGNAEAVRQVELLFGLLRMAEDGRMEERAAVVEVYSTGPAESNGSLDVMPSLHTAAAAATTYSIPVYGLSNDGTVVPAQVTPSLVATMEAESPKEVACEWECILRSVGWPEYAIPAALSVSWCESRWRDVQNFSGGNFWGRFQVSPYWHADKLLARGYPATGQALLNPWVNAEIALMIWSGSGWSQWECKP